MTSDAQVLAEAIDRLTFVVAGIGLGTIFAIIAMTVAIRTAVRSHSLTRR